ncbi:MAG: TIGR03087 family PEP-CTERM/XrtA system glycosyltransferase [Planctomycetes bacterium]|nr:TIGR03087 family PEP-CTERM/XrtA system glycosyltransferase [Planctomycetota bacterium]
MTSRTREILFLAQRVPFPPDRGDRITTWNLLRRFLEDGHRVRVGCFLEAPEDAANAAALRERGCEVFAFRIRDKLRRLKSLPALLGTKPLTLPYFRHGGLRAALRASLAERPADCAYAYSSSMGLYFLDLERELAGARKIAHFAELDSDKWAQYAATLGFPGKLVYGREARTLLEWERKLAAVADLNILVSRVEEQIFEERIPGRPTFVLPNGVDLEHFHPDPQVAKVPRSVVFTGVMNYHPNVDGMLHFVEVCWPKIRARHGDAGCFIVGSRPTPEIEALGGKDGITVTGRVPETVPWMQKASVGIAPLRIARGIQNKVLEAMACGLPVVTSPLAAGGIDATDGEHFMIARDDAQTTAAILELFEVEARARALGAAARARMEERYGWKAVLDQLDTICGFEEA